MSKFKTVCTTLVLRAVHAVVKLEGNLFLLGIRWLLGRLLRRRRLRRQRRLLLNHLAVLVDWAGGQLRLVHHVVHGGLSQEGGRVRVRLIGGGHGGREGEGVAGHREIAAYAARPGSAKEANFGKICH